MSGWPGYIANWGSVSLERSESFFCDELVPEPDLVLFRAVNVDASPAVVHRWLCQLRAAPYSYDLIDNGGRRSPQRLTPGLERLEEGQRFMGIFRLAGFEPGRSITVLSDGRVFGRVACTYRVREVLRGRTRLLVKVLVSRPAGARGWRARAFLLPPGDLIVMRRQLLNLKRLSEGG